MTNRTPSARVAVSALAALLLAACGGESDSITPPALDQVFVDNYGPGVRYEAFSGVPASATVTIDTAEKYSGTASLKIVVPGGDDFVGGAFPTSAARDLSGYDALTFWAKASTAATLNVVGIGVDNQPDPPYIAERTLIPVTTTWTKFVVPIPLAAKLTAEDGLFHFAEGAEDGAYTIWLDEIRFETLGAAALGTPVPAIADETVTREVGATHAVNGAAVTFPLGGQDVTVSASRRYFTWSSSDESAATVDAAGIVTAVAPGSTDITAMLGSIAATGTTTVNVTLANVPAVAAPTPAPDPADVISLFSNAYTNVAVDTWSASWDSADVADEQVAGDDVKKYTSLVFAGIEFWNPAPTVDATGMTHFHLDLWTPDATEFRVKLVDFGADASPGGGDDTEHELTFNAGSTPALVTGQWVSLDIPLSAFANMTARAHVAQLILVATSSTVYVDNVFFYASAAPTEPAVPAPTPAPAAADAISLFSNAYTNVAVDTWSAAWDSADVADVQVGGDDVKKYTSLVFAGIEFWNPAPTVDATGMTHFHLDLWTPDATEFKVKLVDFGADASPGGGDDTEHELTFNASSSPALVTGQWVSLDVPLADFTNLTARGHVAQMILVATNSTVFVDNVYFHR